MGFSLQDSERQVRGQRRAQATPRVGRNTILTKEPIPKPVHTLALVFAGRLSRRQAAAIEYHLAVNRVLLARVEGRLLLTDVERANLAVLGLAMGRDLLEENSLIVQPETILRWHRQLVAAKWTYKARSNPNRVGLMKTIKALAVKFAIENPSWGKRSPWSTHIEADTASIAATDFFTTEVWTARGLVTHYTLFVIDLATRAVQAVATTPHPNEFFMMQVARMLTDPVDGFLRQKTFLIMDRDSIFSEAFRRELRENGVRPCDPRAWASLRIRAQPPRHRQQSHCAQRADRIDRRQDPLPISPRWNVQLRPTRRCLNARHVAR